MVMGDFNGHISRDNGGINTDKEEKTNTNRCIIIEFAKEHDLTMMNKSEKCKGTWTLM